MSNPENQPGGSTGPSTPESLKRDMALGQDKLTGLSTTWSLEEHPVWPGISNQPVLLAYNQFEATAKGHFTGNIGRVKRGLDHDAKRLEEAGGIFKLATTGSVDMNAGLLVGSVENAKATIENEKARVRELEARITDGLAKVRHTLEEFLAGVSEDVMALRGLADTFDGHANFIKGKADEWSNHL